MQPQQPPYGPPPEQVPTPPGPPYPPVPPSAPYSPAPNQYPDRPIAERPSYEFIMNSDQSKKTLIASGSMVTRVLVLAVGLIVLIVLFIVFKGLLGGDKPLNIPDMVSVVQDQSEILNLITTTTNSSTNVALLTTNDQDFLATGNLSIKDEQGMLLAYLKTTGNTVGPETLLLKENPKITTELTASIVANDYQQTFTQVTEAELTTYKHDLNVDYTNTKTLQGRTLLKADYDGAQLLIDELNSIHS
jgi:hypothetical protein